MKDKDRFIRVYSNLPIDIRKEIIVVVDGRPVTWNVAYEEIENETPLGKKIFHKILELELI